MAGQVEYRGENLAELIRSGMGRHEIADMLDVTPAALRSAISRCGLQGEALVKRETQDHFRAIAEEMRPLDAVDYLLTALDVVASIPPPLREKFSEYGLRLTRTQLRVLSVLYENAGEVVSHEALYEWVYFDRIAADDFPSPKTLEVIMVQLRRLIAGLGWRIGNRHGRGWYLDGVKGGDGAA